MVTLYRYNGTVETISLEDYVVGVVGAEMPASFNIEALKAQSVLARTYALKKISQNLVLKDTTSDQVYKDESQLKAMWGDSFQTYYNKIVSAVAATKGTYLTYNGNYIEAVYHSTSNGQTEDAAFVWGNSYPYLKSVDSHWDLEASSYLRETSKEFSVLSSIIGLDFNSTTNIDVLSRTPGNRIDQIKIGDKTFSGVELRNLLGLRSADFDINIEGDGAVFVTRGYGHGVGMSQYGANGMAKEGNSYADILAHYYPGTQLKS
jgi:stage II sporulation protein D